MSVHEVANQAGHSNIHTTLLYTNPSKDDLIHKMNQLQGAVEMMKVKYKDGSIYGPGLVDFPYQEGDYVTIVVRYWTVKEEAEDIYLSWPYNTIRGRKGRFLGCFR